MALRQSIKVINGHLEWLPHHDKWLQSFKDGRYIIELRIEKSKATHPMYRYLFGYVYPEIVKVAGGSANKKEIDYIHDKCKQRFGVEEIVEVPAFRKKVIVYVDQRQPKSLSKYTVEEMQEYWMSLQQMAAETFGLIIHDPDPNWRDEWLKWRKKKGVGQYDEKEAKIVQMFDGEDVPARKKAA